MGARKRMFCVTWDKFRRIDNQRARTQNQVVGCEYVRFLTLPRSLPPGGGQHAR